jgi:hypothetical protein
MSKNKTLLREKLRERNPKVLQEQAKRQIITPVDILDQKGQKLRTDERLNARTNERMNKRTPEREIKRQSFDIFLDQYYTLLDIRTERKKRLKRDVTLGELAQEAFEMFISFERTKEQTGK